MEIGTRTSLYILITDGQTNLEDLVLLGGDFGIQVTLLESLDCRALGRGLSDTGELKINRDKVALGQLLQKPGKVVREVVMS